MLRRVENITVTHRPSFWTKKGPVELTVGREAYRVGEYTKQEFLDRQESQKSRPVLLARIGERRYWQFRGKFYWDNDRLTGAQVHALIVTREQRQVQQIERAQATIAMGSAPRSSTARRSIPDDVKQYIWARDEGTCRACGSTSELQFDHVIPVSMGGSNNSENLQILCGPCNRSKAAGLTIRR